MFEFDIRSIQTALKRVSLYTGEVDGISGPMTRRAAYDWEEIAALRQAGGITTILDNGNLDMRTVNDGGRVGLRPGNGSRYSMRRTAPQNVTIHWTAGATSAADLASYFARTSRAVSSHYAIDKTGIYQYLPTTREAWHATWMNSHSIGIDICQPVVASRLNEALAAGYETFVTHNPSNRGDRVVLKLDEEIAAKTAYLISVLCKIHDIQIKTPNTQEVVFTSSQELGDWSGFVGHHHVDYHKWDVAPWMHDIVSKL